jgi:hypothetical protein
MEAGRHCRGASLRHDCGQPAARARAVDRRAGSLWDAAKTDYARAFLLLLTGTAARPKAVLELTRFQCDIERRLINLNPPGRTQTKKRRPVVPMCDALAAWIATAPAGPLVQYRGKPVLKLNATWRAMRQRAELGPDVVPYSVRHTIATEMRARGVLELEIAGFLGHSMPNFRTTGRYAKYAPDYLGKAASAVQEVLNEIGRVAARPISISETQALRASDVRVPESRNRLSHCIPGAGEGIRTPDPNLGKVVGYPIRKLATVSYSHLNH